MIKGNVYLELELIHNISPLLRKSEFEIYDVFWINTQAKSYFNRAFGRPSYARVVGLINELINICPSSLASQIDVTFLKQLQKFTV